MATEFTAIDYIVAYVLAFVAFIGLYLCALTYRWATNSKDTTDETR